MLTFANPWLFLLLPLVPVSVFWWLRRRPAAILFPQVAILRSLAPGRGRWARRGGAILRGLILGLLVLALTEPRIPDLRTRITTEGIAIQLVVDVSGSMAEGDFLWNNTPLERLEAVQRVLKLFIQGGEGPGGVTLLGRTEDLIGLVTFATRPETECPLTLNHAVLLQLLDAQKPRTGPDQAQTNIGDALAYGLQRLESAGPRRRLLVLVTDGEHNVPAPALTPRQAAQLAAGLHVTTHVFDMNRTGQEAGSTRNGSLEAVAALTGGRYFPADNTAALLNLCQELDRLERQEIQSFHYRRYYELWPWCSLAAFVFLVVLRILEWSWWRVSPSA